MFVGTSGTLALATAMIANARTSGGHRASLELPNARTSGESRGTKQSNLSKILLSRLQTLVTLKTKLFVPQNFYYSF